MSEQQNKAGEGASPAIEQENKSLKQTVESLQKDVEQAKLELLSPEYLAFLEEKKLKKASPDSKKASVLIGELTQEEIETLPKAKLLQLAEQRIGEKVKGEVRSEFAQQIAALSTYVGNIGAYLELQDAKNRHPDFADFAADIQKILDTSKHEITYEQAYLQAKGAKTLEKPTEKSEKAEDKPKPKGSEKPGATTPPEGDVKHEFKTAESAGKAAWEEVKSKYNIVGDTL